MFVFFEVTNEGREPSELSRLYVRSRRDRRPAYEGPFEGDRDLPLTLGPGETARFRVRAKTLAGSLKEAGLGGRPRVRLVVEDGRGSAHEKSFGFRVDDYLRLKDE